MLSIPTRAPRAQRRQSTRRLSVQVLSAALFLGSGLLASDRVDPGPCYRVHGENALEFPANNVNLGGLTHAPDGELIVYGLSDGKVVKGNREPFLELASFEAGTFGSFLEMAPGGERVIFGENSQGRIFSIPLTGGEPTHIDTVPFNFDLVFDRNGNGLVSAPGPVGGNEIQLLDGDPDTPNAPVVIEIPGFSGPLALDAEGFLYYGTAMFDGSPLEVRRFTPQQIEAAVAGSPVVYTDGEVFAGNLEANFDMTWAGDQLYLTDSGFGPTGVGRLLAIDPVSPGVSRNVAIFEKSGDDMLVSPTYLSFHPGDREFLCGEGVRGGRLAVGSGDFATFNRVVELVYELHFIRGEVNADSGIDLTDALAILEYLFLGGRTPDPLVAADANDDGDVDVSDAIYILRFLFLGGDPPPLPYPDRGPDLTG